MFNYTCLNPIAQIGLDNFSDDYAKVENIADADAALVRSAAMHDMELGDKLVVLRMGEAELEVGRVLEGRLGVLAGLLVGGEALGDVGDGAAGAEVGAADHVPHKCGHAGDAAVVEKNVSEDCVVRGARQHAAQGAGVDSALVEPMAGATHAVRTAGKPLVDEQRLPKARGGGAVRKDIGERKAGTARFDPRKGVSQQMKDLFDRALTYPLPEGEG